MTSIPCCEYFHLTFAISKTHWTQSWSFLVHVGKYRSVVSEEDLSGQSILITNSFVKASVYLDQNNAGTFGGKGWHLCLDNVNHNKLVKVGIIVWGKRFREWQYSTRPYNGMRGGVLRVTVQHKAVTMVWGEGSQEWQYSKRHSQVPHCCSQDPSQNTIIPPTALLSCLNYYMRLLVCSTCLCCVCSCIIKHYQRQRIVLRVIAHSEGNNLTFHYFVPTVMVATELC